MELKGYQIKILSFHKDEGHISYVLLYSMVISKELNDLKVQHHKVPYIMSFRCTYSIDEQSTRTFKQLSVRRDLFTRSSTSKRHKTSDSISDFNIITLNRTLKYHLRYM